jgi:hypothetical protein
MFQCIMFDDVDQFKKLEIDFKDINLFRYSV